MTRCYSFSASVAVLLLSLSLRPAIAQLDGEWPQWRGPGRDGISRDKGLLKEWPEGGPPVTWSIDTVGTSYSSLALKDGRIFTQGDLDGVEHVLALRAENGQLLWAVQPDPARQSLDERVDRELQRMDKNGDGRIDELEALAGLTWKFNDFDKPSADGREKMDELAARRAEQLVQALDTDQNGRLSFGECGQLLRDTFARVDRRDDEADAEALAARRGAALLEQLDKDGDKVVSRNESRRSELDRSFNRADKRDPATNKGDEQLTLAEITAYLARDEAGKDGQLSEGELRSYYREHHPGGDGWLTVAELRGYYGGYRNGQGNGPRSTPTVDGDHLYVEGGMGDVSCLDAATGKTLWHVSLREDLGGGLPGWGYSESPLIEENLVIVTPGGKNGTLVALDKMTGEVVWRSSEVTQGAHYSSPVAADIGGIRQIVQFARASVFGVTADGGRLLWEYSAANNGTANCATPLVYRDHVFASSSYGKGGGLAKVVTKGDGQEAEEVYFEQRMANHHGGIVRVGEYMYGFGNGGLICMNFLTGDVAWRDRSVGKGSLCVADGMLYLLSERHEVALAEATPEAYREHGRFKIESHGRPSWAHPIVAGGRLYIRDQQTLTAYDVRKKP